VLRAEPGPAVLVNVKAGFKARMIQDNMENQQRDNRWAMGQEESEGK